MANTALSARAGNAKETHMVFRNEQHEQFYHATLKRSKGKCVLLIDADAQGSLTASLGFTQPDKLEVSLANVMASIINDEDFLADYGISRLLGNPGREGGKIVFYENFSVQGGDFHVYYG